MGTIYILENKINGMKYVGQTINFKKRLKKHLNDSMFIGRALQKYGIDNFDKLLLEEVPEEELDYWETYYIRECNSIYPNGYNLESGGNKNKHVHEETKKKISKTETGRPSPMKNRHHTEEARKKISEAGKGAIFSKERKEKIRKSKLGKPCPSYVKKLISETTKGRKRTEEFKRKISKVTKGEKNPMFGKSVYDIWLKKYGKDIADFKFLETNKKRSITMLKKRQINELQKT
jgi:group I intron endonuclease